MIAFAIVLIVFKFYWYLIFASLYLLTYTILQLIYGRRFYNLLKVRKKNNINFSNFSLSSAKTLNLGIFKRFNLINELIRMVNFHSINFYFGNFNKIGEKTFSSLEFEKLKRLIIKYLQVVWIFIVKVLAWIITLSFFIF